MNLQTFCGYAAILGRPNVGKSTLLNTLLGRKLSITCHKRQTTRHVIHGIKTADPHQIIYVDTPGLHKNHRRTLNRHMNQVATHAVYDVDVAIFVVDAMVWTDEDDYVLEKIKDAECPVILAVNKIDQFHDRKMMLPIIEKLAAKYDFSSVIPICATKAENTDAIEKKVAEFLPEGDYFFESDRITNRDREFLVAEMIREKLFHTTHQEIPYSAAIIVEKMQPRNGVLYANATIFVEKSSQKAIIIGKGGSHLKTIGSQARKELEVFFDQRIYLQIWVKVKQGWADDEKAMQQLGF
jgi:GTPase